MKFKFTNKKYAIRKLTMGVASIAIGTILWGGGYTLSGNSTLGTNIAYAACNPNSYYFLNHYDEYETVYEADGTLAKGEHKVAREVNEGRQLFQLVPINCSYEPYTALGDDELFHKPYEVITNKSNVAKEYELKTLDNNKKKHRTEEDDKEEAKLWDRYMNSPGEFFFETRTRKKVLLNKDENVTEPINNEDGSITIPSHSVSKKYKNRKDEIKEFSIRTIDENYLNKEHLYDDNVYIRNTYNKYVKDYFKLVKVGNVERIPISTTAIETDYVANNTLDYGVRNTTNQGKEGLRENVVTYEVDRNTGDLKNPTTVENTIPMEKKIIEVGTKEKVVYSKKGNDVIKTTITYELNTTTGEVTPHDNEEVIKTGEVKDKVEYLKVNNDVVKRTTTYKVNPENGEVTSEVKDEVIKSDEVKDKIEYLKVNNDVVKRTTTYKVNPENGEVTPEVKDEVIKTGEVKDKVEYLKVNNDVVKKTTTYKVNPETGEVTSEVKDEIIKTGEVKDKVEYLKVGNDVVKRTTTYKVNPENGEVTTEVKDEVIKTGEVKDKVEYLKVGNDIVKRTTTYKVNPETGEVTPEVKDEVIKTGEVKDKIEYLKVGNDVVKRTTTYKVNPENGDVTSDVKDEVIKVGEVKDKVEYLKVGNDVVKRTTTYKVNPKTGEITSEVKDEVVKTEQPKVEHSKGTELPLKQDELPELKVAIIKDKDNNILDVIKENEEPKNIQGYVNTNKSEIDNEGHKVYIYEKMVETSNGTENPPVVNLPEFTGGVNATDAPVIEELPELKVDVRDANTDNKPNNIQDNNTVNNKETQDTTITNKEEDKVVETNKEPIENNKQTINKKDELPKTNASFFSGLGLLAGFGLIRRKKDK